MVPTYAVGNYLINDYFNELICLKTGVFMLIYTVYVFYLGIVRKKIGDMFIFVVFLLSLLN